jgi:lysophospholipase L1-like esterase
MVLVLAAMAGCSSSSTTGAAGLPSSGSAAANASGPAGHRSGAAGARPAGSGSLAPGTPKASARPASSTHSATSLPSRARPAGTSSRSTGPARTAPASAPRTSCHTVAHIGDSTSVGMISPADLPDPAQRLAAQYAAVGVAGSRIDASGGRSIVETLPGQVNGYDAARAMAGQGSPGCWVFALGTNDAADIAVGSAVGQMGRIQEMMSVAAGRPVLWVDVKTLVPSGPYSEANMQVWNATLRQACAQYPNLRIFDWASVAQDGWFSYDGGGIHYTPAGYAARAQMIAQALARAFPAGGHSAGCVIT